ncbi:MAG: heavy metal translocating P-type ATPase, partial [Planctomycetia bacterium]|nr:heavy metal translocating P-type ATPase [Planctomycetia bacterium]
MSQARCTFKVKGLDCPVEVDALNAALKGNPGVFALGFDLLHGTMSVDYDPGTTGPDALIGRMAERAGMHASLLGRPEVEAAADPWRAAFGRWGATAASGLALLLAVATPLLGGPGWLSRGLYGMSVATGGIELFPKAVRGLRSLRFDIHVLMGLAVLGAMGLGQWDEAATVTFLFGLSEALEGLSLERARRAVRA